MSEEGLCGVQIWTCSRDRASRAHVQSVRPKWRGAMGIEQKGGKNGKRWVEGSKVIMSPAHTPKHRRCVFVCVGVQRPWWQWCPWRDAREGRK